MSACGLLEVLLDLRGVVVAVGARVASLAGASEADLVGRPVARFMRGAALTGPPGQTLPLELRLEGHAPVIGRALRAVVGELVSITFLPDAEASAAGPITGASGRPNTRETRRPSTQEVFGVDPRLVSEVVRELHDPLTGITGFATMAQLAATPHRRKYYLDQVTSQAERVRRLAQSLDHVFLARPPLVSTVDLAAELARVVSAKRLALERHGIAFDLTAPHPVWATCDARQIGDMVIAIIHRATLQQRRDYQANEVTLEVKTQHGHATIELALSAADQPALLLRERFGLGDEGRPELTTPSELELDAAQRALKRQNGSCTVTATRATEEVRVVITLPTAPAPPKLDPLRTPVPLELLAIDDDAMIGELYSELLAASGHTVTPARSLYAAREALRQQRFDAVVAEFQLKDGNLSELWAQAAENHPELGSRLLVVTRDPRDQRLREWAAPQGTPILAKPFQPTVLLDLLASLTQ